MTNVVRFAILVGDTTSGLQLVQMSETNSMGDTKHKKEING